MITFSVTCVFGFEIPFLEKFGIIFSKFDSEDLWRDSCDDPSQSILLPWKCISILGWNLGNLHLMGWFPLKPLNSFFYWSLCSWIKHMRQKVLHWSIYDGWRKPSILRNPTICPPQPQPQFRPPYSQPNFSTLTKSVFTNLLATVSKLWKSWEIWDKKINGEDNNFVVLFFLSAQ